MRTMNYWTAAYITCSATVAAIKTRDIKHDVQNAMYGKALVKRHE